MKRFAALALSMLCAAAHGALADSGLEDGDSVRFGFTAVTTVPRGYSSGGVGIHLFGRRRPLAQLTANSDFDSHQLATFMDYDSVIKHVAEEKIARLEMKGGESGAVYALNESFSGEITGKELNDTLAKAKTECPDCATFYIAVSQDTGWGSFDLLPIRNHTGVHSLNHKPSAMHKKDPNAKTEGVTIFNSFIDYLPATH